MSSEPEVVIDWEAKFQQAVSDGIRGKAAIRNKLTDVQLELDRANRRIAAQSLQITKLDPEKTAQTVNDLTNQIVQAGNRISRLSVEVASLKKELLRGERGAMERAITTMQKYAGVLPEVVDSGS